MGLCQIRGNTVYCGWDLKCFLQISPNKYQISPGLRFIEIIGKFQFLSEPVISKNITNSPKVQISRCNHPILRARNIGGYLATICNSTIIEMCDDMFRISHGFDVCQTLEYIATFPNFSNLVIKQQQ